MRAAAALPAPHPCPSAQHTRYLPAGGPPPLGSCWSGGGGCCQRRRLRHRPGSAETGRLPGPPRHPCAGPCWPCRPSWLPLVCTSAAVRPLTIVDPAACCLCWGELVPLLPPPPARCARCARAAWGWMPLAAFADAFSPLIAALDVLRAMPPELGSAEQADPKRPAPGAGGQAGPRRTLAREQEDEQHALPPQPDPPIHMPCDPPAAAAGDPVCNGRTPAAAMEAPDTRCLPLPHDVLQRPQLVPAPPLALPSLFSSICASQGLRLSCTAGKRVGGRLNPAASRACRIPISL